MEQGERPLKIVVTSATIDREKFTEYLGDAPGIEVPGRMYPVEITHENQEVEDYCKRAAEIAAQDVA